MRQNPAWNYERAQQTDRQSTSVCLHYLLNMLQPLPFSQPVVVSLNPVREIARNHIMGEFDYAHPVFDAAAIRAGRRPDALTEKARQLVRPQAGRWPNRSCYYFYSWWQRYPARYSHFLPIYSGFIPDAFQQSWCAAPAFPAVWLGWDNSHARRYWQSANQDSRAHNPPPHPTN